MTETNLNANEHSNSKHPPTPPLFLFLKFKALSSYIKEGMKCDINLVAN